VSTLGKRTLAVSPFYFLFFSLSFFKNQTIEHQTELSPGTSWTPNPWKAYLLSTRLNPLPESICFERSNTPFLPATWFQSCLHKSIDLTGEQYAPHATTPSTHQEYNPEQPLGRFNTPLNKTEKHKQWILIYHRQWGWGEALNQLQRMRVGQRPELSAWEGRVRNKGWEQGWVTSQTGGVADH
jgi:hypothetical protein